MFSGSDVVNYGSRGYRDGKFRTFLEQGLLSTGKWFAKEVVDTFFLQFVTTRFPGGSVVFEVIYLITFFSLG